ncbi:histidinol phosphate aminotransferase [Allosediminivita pacifica]|uniref:Uncharacterized protein n=1 Tax=Allosediminivita pacifica TaxID=1267769 RepID=A0A2T6ABC2_9RHOB|nr:histidinol phosphate aminotransferase [Allosediminivita pacifica]PTX41123.1 hypothetical protein C8N44_13228 [Allosediminivita pacifica]
MNSQFPGRVEDYTRACLVLIFVNLLWVFALIWATWGFFPVLLLAVVLNHAITRLGPIRARRQREVIRRGKGRPDRTETPRG